MKKKGNLRPGKGGNERSEGLEGGHAHPAGLVLQQVDEELAQIVTSLRQRHHSRDAHKHLGARLTHAPQLVLTQRVKLIQEDSFGGLLADDRAEIAEIGRQDLADVEEDVAGELGEAFEEDAPREVAAQQRRHPTQQLPDPHPSQQQKKKQKNKKKFNRKVNKSLQCHSILATKLNSDP